MLKYKYLYQRCISHVRRAYGKKELSEKVVSRRMDKVIDGMSIEDRYYLELFETYHTMQRVAMIAEVTVRKATHRVNVAMNHLINPKNISDITGVVLFKHTGVNLGAINNFSQRTVNALKRQDILTDDDLCKWLQLGLVYLYNIPGVGKWGQLEILKYLESAGKLKLK